MMSSTHLLLILILYMIAIGPARLYSPGKIYSGLLHMFWIGATLPLITFFLRKKFPHWGPLNAVHWPIFFAGTGNLPPAVSSCLKCPASVSHED
jgi:hypothetical protein